MFYVNQKVIVRGARACITQLWKNKARVQLEDASKDIVALSEIQTIGENTEQLTLLTVEETKPAAKQSFLDWEVDVNGEVDCLIPQEKIFVREEIGFRVSSPTETDQVLSQGDVVKNKDTGEYGVIFAVGRERCSYEDPRTGKRTYLSSEAVTILGQIPDYLEYANRYTPTGKVDLDPLLEEAIFSAFDFFVREEMLEPISSLTDEDVVREEMLEPISSLTDEGVVREEMLEPISSLTDEDVVREEMLEPISSLTAEDVVREEMLEPISSLTDEEFRRFSNPVYDAVETAIDLMPLFEEEDLLKIFDAVMEEFSKRRKPITEIKTKPKKPGRTNLQTRTIEEKYIVKEDGKKYGPYLYERYQENGRLRSRYLGKKTS